MLKPEQYQKVQAALQSGKMLVLVGACEVQYKGRARSNLEEGERVVLVKPDGALLVHWSEGHKPVNWNPPGSRQKVEIHNGCLELVSTRKNAKEKVEILFSDLVFFESFDLNDSCDINLAGSQDDMVKRIMQDPNLIEPSFQPEEDEKDREEGDVDLYAHDLEGVPVACELKRAKAEKGDASRLNRYVEGLEEQHDKVRGFLIPHDLTTGVMEYLDKKGLEFAEVSPLLEETSVDFSSQRKLESFLA